MSRSTAYPDSTPTGVRAPLASPGERAERDKDKVALSEVILSDLFALYNDPPVLLKKTEFGSVGLRDIARMAHLKPELLTPRRRVTVLIIGNHSAGKSSFINHYVEQAVQNTGVAVESTGFTIIRAGRQDQDVNGEGSLVDNEHIAAVANRLGPDRLHFLENLSLCVRTSGAKDFKNVDFIDTPGLCDGEITYPFDVNATIIELATVADLILVFLDPVGKAQVSRTMDIVESLSKHHKYYDRMRFYLTKADTANTPQDLNKVVAQVSQNLAKRLYNTHGFEIPPMWLPPQEGDRAEALAARGFLPDHNGLNKLLLDIKRTINTKVQANMTTCQKDCRRIIDQIDSDIFEEHRRVSVKRTWACYIWMLFPWFVVLAVVSFLDVLVAIKSHLPAFARKAPFVVATLEASEPFVAGVDGVMAAMGFATLPQRLLAVLVAFFAVAVLVQFFRCRSRMLRTRTSGELSQLRLHQQHTEVMLKHVTDLYQRYIRAAQTPEYEPTQPGAGFAAVTPNVKKSK